MVARPGRSQTTYTAGELDPLEFDRTELKYYHAGAKHVENVELHPQGGFSRRDGLRHVTNLQSSSDRLIPFKNSKGISYELALRDNGADVLELGGVSASFGLPLSQSQIKLISWASRMDTLFIFHKDVETPRITVRDDGWHVDTLPYEDIPNHDYGLAYTNNEPAEWELNFVGFNAGKRFRITVSGQNTVSIALPDPIDWDSVAADIKTAILDLPNVAPGIDVQKINDEQIKITFAGDDNAGDGWAVSGTPINDADAAMPAYKLKVGIPPGEPIISTARGWPRCGMFFQQRLMVGGFNARPNNYMVSIVGRYFSFNTDLDEANGAFVVPLDTEGGETINHLAAGQNMIVFTGEREQWVTDRTIDKTKPTNHAEASANGSKEGVPVVKNEGAVIYCHKSGSVLSEIRYTDLDAFVSQPISILSPHLFEDVTDLALRRAQLSTDANHLGVLDEKGRMRAGFLLREQDVTGFGRYTSADCAFKAIAVNGRDEMSVITERNGDRRFERFETGLLLDASFAFSHEQPQTEIINLDHLEGSEVWVIGDDNIYGPYNVADNRVTVDVPVKKGEVGLFAPVLLETLPPPREVGPKTVLRRKARIHSVWVSVVNSTSLAVGVNGQPPVDVPLRDYDGDLEKPELQDGYTGLVELRGLEGFANEPTVTVTQLRPGRLSVRSITAEAKL